jgi:hypothetical protein
MAPKRREDELSDRVLDRWVLEATDDFAEFQAQVGERGLAGARKLWRGREEHARRVIVLVAALRSCRTALSSRPGRRTRPAPPENEASPGEG